MQRVDKHVPCAVNCVQPVLLLLLLLQTCTAFGTAGAIVLSTGKAIAASYPFINANPNSMLLQLQCLGHWLARTVSWQ
jgi:hypothetical protein